jgi:hypothetical protein
MQRGEKWHCVTAGCGAEIVVTESSKSLQTGKPRCGCGGDMKRPYEKPMSRKLNVTN